MTITNEFIGKRIREARRQREKTQADLAEFLGKTPGAISQMEMGNVQISVVELKKVADYLNKPIEYFLGEDYLGDDVQAIIAIFRKMDFETRSKQAEAIRTLLDLQEIADQIEQAEENNNEERIRQLGVTFYQKLIPFVTSMQKLSSQSTDIQEKLSKVLEIENIDTNTMIADNEGN